MKNLTNITLLSALLAVSGCGDDAAPPAADTPVTSTETTVTSPVELSYPKPPWAVLEQNVYFYPD
ncbi:MAG: hypothetical protein V3R68_00655 [Gammaproteobacteria bacterium]|jgi:hypothetical protein